MKPTQIQNPPLCFPMWLSVEAPVRVYLHRLVRRLLYSHLTPFTLSSPFLTAVLSPLMHSHPDTPSPQTTLLHGWLCLVFTITACLLLGPDKHHRFSVCASSGSWGSETSPHRGRYRSWGSQVVVHKHSDNVCHLDICFTVGHWSGVGLLT